MIVDEPTILALATKEAEAAKAPFPSFEITATEAAEALYGRVTLRHIPSDETLAFTAGAEIRPMDERILAAWMKRLARLHHTDTIGRKKRS